MTSFANDLTVIQKMAALVAKTPTIRVSLADLSSDEALLTRQDVEDYELKHEFEEDYEPKFQGSTAVTIAFQRFAGLLEAEGLVHAGDWDSTDCGETIIIEGDFSHVYNVSCNWDDHFSWKEEFYVHVSIDDTDEIASIYNIDPDNVAPAMERCIEERSSYSQLQAA